MGWVKHQRCRACNAVGHNTRTCKDAEAIARLVAGAVKPKKRTSEAAKRRSERRARKANERKIERRRREKISPSELRSEGVLEVGWVIGVVLYVRTSAGLHLFRECDLPERELDGYALDQARHMLQQGFTEHQVAHRFGMHHKAVGAQLRAAGVT